MALLISQLSIDCHDPLRLAAWWGEVLGWPVGSDPDEPDEAWVEPAPGSVGAAAAGTGLLFLKVPEGKAAKNRLHLDLRPADGSDQAREVARLEALGATRVDIGQGDVSWVVLADPEGNEFCILRSTPSELAAATATA